jgi:Asp-tRNA(Asn)/Glu-tRNA(Gln) amidotransferase B subunit
MSEKKGLTIVDRSTKAFSKATQDLLKVLTELKGLGDVNESMLSDIEFNQSKLDEIAELTKTDIRKAKAELDLRVTENSTKVLNELLKKNGLAEISVEDLNALKEALTEALEDNSEAVTKAVTAAEKVLHISYKGDMRALEGEYRVGVAEKDAEIKSLKMRVEFMQETIDSQSETIEAERAARVAIAEAESKKSGVTVNTGTK